MLIVWIIETQWFLTELLAIWESASPDNMPVIINRGNVFVCSYIYDFSWRDVIINNSFEPNAFLYCDLLASFQFPSRNLGPFSSIYCAVNLHQVENISRYYCCSSLFGTLMFTAKQNEDSCKRFSWSISTVNQITAGRITTLIFLVLVHFRFFHSNIS